MSTRRYDTVSLLTDLGAGSDAVGVVKSVLRDLAPHVVVIDITHDVRPFDVRDGSLALARAVPYLPEGIIVACVDPGAGTDRRLVAVGVAGGAGVFIGPDNGLLATGVALAGGADSAFVLDRDEHHLASPGRTFAARDVLAPVAAALCGGTALNELGSEVDPASLLPSVIPIPRVENDEIVCEILWVDRFGNCQLNVSTDDLATAWGAVPERVRVRFSDEVRSLVIATSFGDLGPGAPGLVVDASGLLCVALDRASAADELELSEGASVHVSRGGDDAPTVPVRLRA